MKRPRARKGRVSLYDYGYDRMITVCEGMFVPNRVVEILVTVEPERSNLPRYHYPVRLKLAHSWFESVRAM